MQLYADSGHFLRIHYSFTRYITLLSDNMATMVAVYDDIVD